MVVRSRWSSEKQKEPYKLLEIKERTKLQNISTSYYISTVLNTE